MLIHSGSKHIYCVVQETSKDCCCFDTVFFDGGKTDNCLKCKLLTINLFFIELLYKYKHIAYGQP